MLVFVAVAFSQEDKAKAAKHFVEKEESRNDPRGFSSDYHLAKHQLKQYHFAKASTEQSIISK